MAVEYLVYKNVLHKLCQVSVRIDWVFIALFGWNQDLKTR